MAPRAQEFQPSLVPTSKPGRLLAESTQGLNFLSNYFRDSLHFTTWLSLAFLVQSLLLLILGRRALIPPAVLVFVRTTDTLLQAAGWKHNTYMDGVLPGKTATAFPDAAGNYGNKPANNEICVFILGTRCNHPLGALAPGMAGVRSHFPVMTADLEAHREEYGYLTSTAWFNLDQRQASSELLNIVYFKNVEGLHKFAHAAAHREVWAWFNRHTREWPHISIWHETYQVPRGNWETIYINSHVQGINRASLPQTDEKTGESLWNYPIVDASKGLLKTSAGRMSRSNATEHDVYGDDPYDEQ